jgi:hypothetical protein
MEQNTHIAHFVWQNSSRHLKSTNSFTLLLIVMQFEAVGHGMGLEKAIISLSCRKQLFLVAIGDS